MEDDLVSRMVRPNVDVQSCMVGADEGNELNLEFEKLFRHPVSLRNPVL